MALFLLRGNLPWKPRPHEESSLRSQEIVRRIKSNCSGQFLSDGFPVEFGELLDHSRSLEFNQFPDYDRLRRVFGSMAEKKGDGPLDWTPCFPKTNTYVLDGPLDLVVPGEYDPPKDLDDPCWREDPLGENSYFAMDIDMWDSRQGERDEDLTLLAEQEVALDLCVPWIAEVDRGFKE